VPDIATLVEPSRSAALESRVTVAEWLACYRAVRLLQRDDVWPLPEARAAIMKRWGTSRWSALLDCPWCLSVWVAAVLAVLRVAAPRLHGLVVAVLAASATTGIVTEVLDAVAPPE
jgi:hypothetical protein